MPLLKIISNVDIGELYGEPISWEQFDKVVDKSLGDFDDDALLSMNDDDIALFNMDGIRAEVAHIEGLLEPMVFHHMVHENAVRSKAAMAMGSVSFDDSACEIFESVARLLILSL